MEPVQTEDSVEELNWGQTFAALLGVDYDVLGETLTALPSAPPLSPQPARSVVPAAHGVPPGERPGPGMAPHQVYHGSEGPECWDQPGPVMADSDMYYHQGSPYWDQPGPVMANYEMYYYQGAPYWEQPDPSVYGGPVAPEHWKQPVERESLAGAYTHNQAKTVPKMRQPESINMRPAGKNTKMRAGIQDVGRQYVKKPPNAFMLFMKERRPLVVAKHRIRDNAAVNKVLGQMWRSLTKRQQAPYYEQALMERQLHDQQHPKWSCKENYGKKRKRVRRKCAYHVTASGPECEEDTQQAKRVCVSSPHMSSQVPRCSSLSSHEILPHRLTSEQLTSSYVPKEAKRFCMSSLKSPGVPMKRV